MPHSEIHGSKGARPSPQLIAACHVLHRLLLPRHPSNALESLDRSSFVFMHGEDCAGDASITRHTRPRPRTNALDNVEVHPASQPTALTRTDEPSIHDVIEPPARLVRDGELVFSYEPNSKNWWSQTGSNRRPEACKATALPTELWPRSIPNFRRSSGRPGQI